MTAAEDRIHDCVDEIARRVELGVFNAYRTPGRPALTLEQYEARASRVRANRAAWEVLRAEQMPALKNGLATLADPGVVAVLAEHAIDSEGECRSCGGPEWPCLTVVVIAEAHNIPVPIDFHHYTLMHPIPED